MTLYTARKKAQQIGRLNNAIARMEAAKDKRAQVAQRILRRLVVAVTQFCLEQGVDPYIFFALELGMPEGDLRAEAAKD
jgi:hypothetical protein